MTKAKAATITTDLAKFLRSEEHCVAYRGYLGMSGIGNCPRQQYFNFVDPQPPDDRLAWYKWIGYSLENETISLLRAAGCEFTQDMSQHDIVADFDERYRGHIDHMLADRTLVEIKSVHWTKFVRIRASNKPPVYNWDQCQAYMRHGDFPQGLLVYVCRDIPHWEWDKKFSWRSTINGVQEFLAFWIIDVKRDEGRMNFLDRKAKRILEAIDKSRPPECECKYCNR